MAVSLSTGWQHVAGYTWEPGTGFSVTFWLDALYTGQSVDGNYTHIETRLTSKINAGSGSGDNYSFSCSFAPTVSGTGRWYLENETITSGSGNVEHNADGTKSLRLSANATITAIGLNVTFGEDVILPTIPRKSSISNKTATIGKATTISWSRASSNFTHKLTYAFGSASGTIGTGLGTSVSWTPPESLYQYIKNAKSGRGTLTLTTYSGSTNLGSVSSTLTLNANETDCKPELISRRYEDTNANVINLTLDNKYIMLNASNVKFYSMFMTKNYTSISKVTLDGIDITENVVLEEETDIEKTYSVEYTLPKVTKWIYTIIVTDKRGYEKNINISFSNYKEYIPVSSNIQMYRPLPTTGEIVAKFSGNYFNGVFGNVTNNKLKLSYVYKKSSEEAYSKPKELSLNIDYQIFNNTYLSGKDESEEPSMIEISLGKIYDYKEEYNFIFYYEDKLTNGEVSITVLKGIPIVNWNKTKFNINGKLEIEGTEVLSKDTKNNVVLNNTIYERYSEEEIPVGKWIDGKTIYRRVFNFGYLTTVGENYISTDLDMNNFNFTKLIGIVQSLNPNGDAYRQVFPIPSARPDNNNNGLGIWINKLGEIHIHTGSVNRSQYYAYVIVEYTKTTDTV